MLKWMALFLATYLPVCSAAHPYEREILKIPRVPSAPPSLIRRSPTDHPHCERFYVYEGKTLECDSHLGNDGERLRPLMKEIPSALSELDLYQENRLKMRTVAYVGTAGLLAMILGAVLSRPAFDPTSGAPRLGGYFILGGAGVVLNAVIYGLSMNKVNEAHLGRAVELHNAVRPDHSIELKFSTDVHF